GELIAKIVKHFFFLSGETEALLFKKPEYCVTGQVCFVASEANHEIVIVKAYGCARASECTIDSEIRKLITDHVSHSVCAFWFHLCEVVQVGSHCDRTCFFHALPHQIINF